MYSYSPNIADQLSAVRSSGQALAVRTLSSRSHLVIALTSWCIGVITPVSTRLMYPLHLDARANDPRVSLAIVGSDCSTLEQRKFQMTPPPDTSPELSSSGKTHIQSAAGSLLLYHGHDVDPTVRTAASAIGSKQSTGNVQHIFNYKLIKSFFIFTFIFIILYFHSIILKFTATVAAFILVIPRTGAQYK
jgi:hypothetical protein